MNRTWRRGVAVALGLALGTAIMPARADCIPWRAAQSLIADERLVPAGPIYRLVKQRVPGQIIQANLCRDGRRYFYRVVVLDPKGNVVNLSIDARTGQP